MMKNLKYFIILIVTSLIFMPNVFAKENVEIKSVTLDSKSDSTVIKKEATFSGLEMNIDVSFRNIGDYAKYKIVVKNGDNKDYKISENLAFNKSEYVDYKYDVNKKLKANSETEVYVTITYSKSPDDSKYVDGLYNESNKAIVQLLDSVNPTTFSNGLPIVIALVCILGLSVIAFRNNKKVRNTALILLIGLSISPAIVKAADSIKLTVNANVEIPKTYKVGYAFSDLIKASEKDNYDLTYAEYYGTVYIGDSESEENKYLYYYGIIKYDSNMYAGGDKVTVKDMEIGYSRCLEGEETKVAVASSESKNIKAIKLNSTNINVYNVYELNNDNICPTLETYSQDYWRYSIDDNNYVGFNASSSDKQIMNFSSISYDRWSTDEYLHVTSGTTFTMPSHDIIFVSAPVEPR